MGRNSLPKIGSGRIPLDTGGRHRELRRPGSALVRRKLVDDYVLTVGRGIVDCHDNSGVFLRCQPLGDYVQPAIEEGHELRMDDGSASTD